jgi:hypothetical protein
MNLSYNDRVVTPEGWTGIVKAWERRDGPLLARVNETTPPYRMEWFKETDLRPIGGGLLDELREAGIIPEWDEDEVVRRAPREICPECLRPVGHSDFGAPCTPVDCDYRAALDGRDDG